MVVVMGVVDDVDVVVVVVVEVVVAVFGVHVVVVVVVAVVVVDAAAGFVEPLVVVLVSVVGGVVVVIEAAVDALVIHVVVVVVGTVVVAAPAAGFVEPLVVVLVAVVGGVVVVVVVGAVLDALVIHVMVVVVGTIVVTSAVAVFAATLVLTIFAVVEVINIPDMVVVEAAVEIIMESGVVELAVVAVGAIVICMGCVEVVVAAVRALFVVLAAVVEDLVAALGARKPSLTLEDASTPALTNIGWWERSSVIAIDAFVEDVDVVAVLVVIVVGDTSVCKEDDPASVEELRKPSPFALFSSWLQPDKKNGIIEKSKRAANIFQCSIIIAHICEGMQ
jgi:hypothetical protein